MMWEGEYMEFAKTAKAGYLSKQESEHNWSTWLADMAVVRDNDGPRGYLRLWVKTKDSIMQ